MWIVSMFSCTATVFHCTLYLMQVLSNDIFAVSEAMP